MKRKYIKGIKNLVQETEEYKIYNTILKRFKDAGVSGKLVKLSKTGKTWYKLGDVKKAYNLIPENEKREYIIVKISLKVKALEEIEY